MDSIVTKIMGERVPSLEKVAGWHPPRPCPLHLCPRPSTVPPWASLDGRASWRSVAITHNEAIVVVRYPLMQVRTNDVPLVDHPTTDAQLFHTDDTLFYSVEHIYQPGPVEHIVNTQQRWLILTVTLTLTDRLQPHCSTAAILNIHNVP